MAAPLDTLSLSQLLDLAIGMPDNGAVHFAAMRKLLQAVLEHLDVQYLTTQEPWPGQLSGPSLADVAAEVKEIKEEMEVHKKQMSQVLHEDLMEIQKAQSARAEEVKELEKEQKELEKEQKELEKEQKELKKEQKELEKEQKELEKEKDEGMSLSVDLLEEIARIKTTQTRMAQKIKELAALMKKMEENIKKLREETAKCKEECRMEISQQLEAVLQETKQELQKMEEQQEMRVTMLEQLVTETAKKVNEQLAEVGEIVVTVKEEQEKAKAECSNCTFDINVHLGELLQRCEKLQEQVDTLESQHMAVGKLQNMMRKWGKPKEEKQDTEQMQPKDDTVVQMQKDYEKLSVISGTLQKELQQKQKAIEMLFQSLEKLQKEKADEQDVLAAMDVKADKAALGTKVNCSQFDANMERLDERMQELQSQISGQKEHWDKVQQQFSDAMEEKLDRLELKTFSNQVEEMWKKSVGELKSMMKEDDNAAGIKKQLPVPFTCLSCDRMLTMHVPGPYPETLPYLQPLPPSKEPQLSQRRPVVHGSVPRVPQIFGDHQSSSFTLPPIQASLRSKAVLHGLMTLPNKPRVNQLLGSGAPFSRGCNDQLPLGTRTRDESGPAASWVHRPGTAPRHVSRSPGLLQPLQPHGPYETLK